MVKIFTKFIIIQIFSDSNVIATHNHLVRKQTLTQIFELTLVLKLHDFFWIIRGTYEGVESTNNPNNKIRIMASIFILDSV